MTRSAKTGRPDNVVEGPGVRRWHCPCCLQDVPRLLPNGMLNRHALAAGDLWLPHPDTQTAARELGARPGDDICLGCRDTLRQLLGTLLVPASQQAEPMDTRGRPGTRIVGAILPNADDETLILVFDSDVDARLVMAELIPLSRFDARRMTYPVEQGAIPPAVWEAYQAALQTLHEGD